MKISKLSNLVLTSVVGFGLLGASGTASASATSETPPAAVVAAASATEPGGAAPQALSDANRYAQREKSASTQENFRGGGASIYIGGSAVAVALVIVLIILVL
jgi:hypothetical protein